MKRIETGLVEQEYALPPVLEFEPDEWRIRIPGFERRLTVADLADEYSIIRQKTRRVGEHDVHNRQAVRASRKAELRLVAKLGRQGLHIHAIDIRRIRDDQLVARVGQGGEYIRLYEPDAVAKLVAVDVDSCHLERRCRDVYRIDPCARKRHRQRDRNAATPGANVDSSPNIGGGPGSEARRNQFGERRPWHQYALVDIERHARKPAFVEQIAERDALIDPAGGKLLYPLLLRRGHAACVSGIRVTVIEPERRKHQPGRLVGRVVRTVPVAKRCRVEATRDAGNEFVDAHGAQIYHAHGLKHARIAARALLPEPVRPPLGIRQTIPIFNRMNRTLVIAVLVFGLLAGALLAIGVREAPLPSPAQPRAATVLPAATPLPDFELVDHTGVARTRTLFTGQWQLLFFGFTECPDICPTTLATLSSATTALADQGFADVPQIVLVSVDPDRDTPERLAEYITHFGDDHVALTGDVDALRELTDPLYIYFRKVPLGEDNYTVDHSSVVLLINPDGEFHALFSGPIRSEDLVNDLPIIFGEA